MSHTATVRFARKFDFLSFLSFIGALAIMLAITGAADAGGTATTMFDSAATATDEAVFGPLAKMVIGIGTIGGGILAFSTGKWLYAGIGVVIAALVVLAQLVANSAAFGALI